MKPKQRVGSLKVRLMEHFRKGHGSYGGYVVSFLNFVVIQYSRFSVYLSTLGLLFGTIFGFGAVFICIYIPVMMLLGYLDWKFVQPARQELHSETSPFNKDLTKALILMCDNKNEEAKIVLSRWTG